MKAYKQGMSWKEARNFVLHHSYSPIAQYSPVNLGFQTIGLLYGKDFADALCKAVNCGYDTDCTGATLGALLGIISGKEGLPDKWIKPLSDKITTNSSWGGIRNVREPKNLDDLTKRVCRMGRKVISFYKEEIFLERKTVSKEIDLGFGPDENIKKLWYTSPTKVDFNLHTLIISVDYLNTPVIQLGVLSSFKIIIKNTRLVNLKVDVSIETPLGWNVEPKTRKMNIKPGAESIGEFSIKVNNIKELNISNRADIYVLVSERPKLEKIPLVFLSANRWLISNVFKKEEIMALNSLEANPNPDRLNEKWTVIDFFDNELKIEERFYDKPVQAHFVISGPAPFYYGLADLIEYKFPWEV